MSKSEAEEEDEVEEWFDFSQSGEWEKMIACIENIFTDQWNLVNTTCPNSNVTETKTFRFGSETYSLSLHGSKGASPPEIDEASLSLAALWMMDNRSDFNIQVHEITRWFGVRDFLLCRLEARQDSYNSSSKINKSTARQILSSICLALNNVDSCIPVFIVVDEPSMGKRLGTCRPSTHQGVSSTEFECDMVSKIPRKYDHVDGLMELFKSKIRVRRSSVMTFKPTVDVRYTWMIDSRRSRWRRDNSLVPDLRWRRGPIRRNRESSRWSYIDNGVRLLEGADFDGVPICGDVNDPLRSIHVSARFPTFRDNQFVDNSVYSDLRKLIAQDLNENNKTLNASWSVRANWSQSVKTPLTDCVRGIVRLTTTDSNSNSSMQEEAESFLNVQSVRCCIFFFSCVCVCVCACVSNMTRF